jgi:hypothetical protein
MKAEQILNFALVGIVGAVMLKVFGGIEGLTNLFGSLTGNGNGAPPPTPAPTTPEDIIKILKEGGTVGIKETQPKQPISPSIMYFNPIGQMLEFISQQQGTKETQYKMENGNGNGGRITAQDIADYVKKSPTYKTRAAINKTLPATEKILKVLESRYG